MIEEQRPDVESIVDGDAATHLEALGLVAVPLPPRSPGPRGSRSSSSASTCGSRGR